MKHGMRLITAVLVSTFCVIPLYLILSVVTGDLDNSLLIPVLMITPVFAVIGVLLVGLPVHFFLVWWRMSRPIHYGLPGFVIPALCVAIAHPFGEDGALWISWQSILMGAFGAVVALVFRHFALDRRPVR